ncbi:hypothetical protein MTP99_017428 [Tenebrio molitor]|jgi:hypothetical protein|nr:hypothetical protein MTP99_017428 [Tenebrio molitor]
MYHPGGQSSVAHRKMKISAVTVALAISAALYHRGAEARVTKCYTCYMFCHDRLEVEECQDAESVDYKCLSTYVDRGSLVHINNTFHYVHESKGCVRVRDSVTLYECDAIDDIRGGSCYTCDTDLCNSAAIYLESVLLFFCMLLVSIKII